MSTESAAVSFIMAVIGTITLAYEVGKKRALNLGTMKPEDLGLQFVNTMVGGLWFLMAVLPTPFKGIPLMSGGVMVYVFLLSGVVAGIWTATASPEEPMKIMNGIYAAVFALALMYYAYKFVGGAAGGGGGGGGGESAPLITAPQ